MTSISPTPAGPRFACVGVRSDPHAAGPTLVFRLRITADEGERVHALSLRCLLRLEPAKRRYDDAEREGLTDLFGDRTKRPGTLHPIQFAQISLTVPGFTGETETDLVVPCTYDMEVAATRYFHALGEDGVVPLLLLFAGTAFSGPGGFRPMPIPWDREASCQLPVSVWREMIAHHFPGDGWIRLPHRTVDELVRYRSRHGLPSWEATVASLLAHEREPLAAPAGGVTP